MRILFFGDVVGKSGRRAIATILPELRAKYQPDLVIANVENLAHGKGLTLKTFEELLSAGVDFFTSGNHVFDKPEAAAVFAKYPELVIRPANLSGSLPGGAPLPGRGWSIIKRRAVSILALNLNGQVFMENQFDFGRVESPFAALDELLREHGRKATVRILDFHAEATSEKRGMGWWADGRISAVIGTHTHIQTADAQVLPKGTGYLTDAGMVGAADSILGVTRESALKRFLSQSESPAKAPLLVDESERYEIGAVILEIDEATGKCQNIEGKLVFLK